MKLSRHAKIRMQQRGICRGVINLLQTFGERVYSSGSEVIYFNQKSRTRIKSHLTRNEYLDIEKKLNSYLVLKNEIILTVGVRYKKIFN